MGVYGSQTMRRESQGWIGSLLSRPLPPLHQLAQDDVAELEDRTSAKEDESVSRVGEGRGPIEASKAMAIYIHKHTRIP